MSAMDFPENDGCDNPDCTRDDRSNSYKGPNGNTLRVCDKCYWELITDKKKFSLSPGVDDGPHMEMGPIARENTYIQGEDEVSSIDEVDFGDTPNVEYHDEE